MIINFLLKKSLKQQIVILFFIATADFWIMFALSLIVIALGLGNDSVFRLDERVGTFAPYLITEYSYYYKYIYVPRLDFNFYGLGKPVYFLSIFHIAGFYLSVRVIWLKYAFPYRWYVLVGLIILFYGLGFLSAFIGLLQHVFIDTLLR